SPVSPLADQRAFLSWFGMAALFVGTFVWATRLGGELGGRRLLQTLGLLGLAIAAVFYVRASFMASYQFGDVAREMLIYTQTTPDVTAVMREIDRLSHRTGQGTNFKVAYDSGVSWPFEWYLRNQKGRFFYGDGAPPTDAGVVLVSFEPSGSGGQNREEVARQTLGSNYVSTRFRLRWWFPERYRGLRPWDIPEILRNEQARNELKRFLLYREIEPLDSTDFAMFVRRDLLPDLASPITPAAGNAPAAGAPASGSGNPPGAPPPNQPPAGQIESPTKIQSLGGAGSPGSGDGQLTDAKGIAIAPDGSIWVADTG